MEERPAGNTLIVILYFILSGLSLLWSGLVFGWGGFSSLFGRVFGAAQARAYGEAVAWSGFMGMMHRGVDRSRIRLVGNEKMGLVFGHDQRSTDRSGRGGLDIWWW